MPRTTQSTMTTDQAITKAQRILQTGVQLQESAQTAAETVQQYGNRSLLSRAADDLKENRLLGYRVSTVPEMLAPILEALIAAAAGKVPVD